MAFSIVSCGNTENDDDNTPPVSDVDPNEKSDGTLTYEQYVAAPLKSDVVIEAFVQAKQGWWADKATLYLQDGKGGYFSYNTVCSEELYGQLAIGTKVKISGQKIEWSGEVEISGGSVEIVPGDTWIAPVKDVTALLGDASLVNDQNKKVSFKGLTVVAQKDSQNNDVAFLRNYDGSGIEGDDSDLYFNASINGATYTFVIEYYLTGADSAAYQTVEALQVGDVIDMEGFLYWYNGSQPHITKITVK